MNSRMLSRSAHQYRSHYREVTVGMTGQVRRKRWTILAIGAIALFAFMVRVYYVCTASVDHPIRGDAVQYLAYARNLVAHHVFSMQAPSTSPTPDSFRDPGFPVFLASLLSIFGLDGTFYAAVLITQSALSALTVGIYAVLANRFFGLTASIVVGVALALWPHLIVLSGYVLSETLLGFLVASAILLLTVAIDRRSEVLAGWAGVAFAAAALTNAVLAPVIPFIAALAAWRDVSRRRLWFVVLLATLLPLLIWAGRNASLPAENGSGDRATMNFIQGSWPEYHDAWSSSILRGDDNSVATMKAMEAEYQQTRSSPLQGIKTIASRLRDHPLRYLRWYASKPVELWGWRIGIGSGDIYVFPTYNSPLSTAGPLKTTTDIAFLLNPILMVLAVVGLVLTLYRPSDSSFGLAIAALIVMSVTIVFAVLQSDARYSIPYRGIEWLLAYGAMHQFAIWVRANRKSYRSADFS